MIDDKVIYVEDLPGVDTNTNILFHEITALFSVVLRSKKKARRKNFLLHTKKFS